jgi:hypothetical protein
MMYPLFFHACYTPYRSHPPWLIHSSDVGRGIQVMKLLVLQSYKQFILLSTRSPTHSMFLCFRPIKPAGKNIIAYPLICIFLDIRQENKRFWAERHQALLKFNLLLIFLRNQHSHSGFRIPQNSRPYFTLSRHWV